MSNLHLYPQLNVNGAGASFDEYDSIIDEFSIGCDNSEISSIHMSEVGEIAAGVTIEADINKYHTTSDAIPSLPAQQDLAPATMKSTSTMHNNNDDDHNHGNVNRNEYYYHVGDLYHVDALGTDMSATSSIGPSSLLDVESLLTNNTAADEGGAENEEDQHSLLSAYAIKNDVLMMINKSIKEVKYNNEDGIHRSRVSNQLGPLGDELSYVDNSLDYQHTRHEIYEQDDDNYDYANHDNYFGDEEDDEDDANDCILPNLITYSSQKSKCFTVFSAAFILGVLVFAIVAVGASYSSNGNINPFNSSGSGSIGSSSSISIPTTGDSDASNTSIDSVNLPDEGGKDGFINSSQQTKFTARPTASLTISGTSSAAVASSTSSLPTSPPRVEEDKPIQEQQVMKLVPTKMPSEQPSLLLRHRPSYTPTLSSYPTSLPSVSNVPSIAPTLSSQPSWPVGNDSITEGDARFYLMADGGSNEQFWTSKLEKLKTGDHKFLVHLGSAIRVVDDCDPSAYARTEVSLSNSPIPVYSIPGDNDYPKCTNPSEGWEYYKQHMMNINSKYWDAPQEYDVKRQVQRKENFSFLYHRVLFIGLNMVSNVDDEWETASRVQNNIDWVSETVQAYWDNADVIFVMGYGRLLTEESVPFYDAMVSMTKKNSWADKLLVYARRSSELDIDRNVGGNKNFMELRVAAQWPILDVSIKTRMDGAPKLDFAFVNDENV